MTDAINVYLYVGVQLLHAGNRQHCKPNVGAEHAAHVEMHVLFVLCLDNKCVAGAGVPIETR